MNLGEDIASGNIPANGMDRIPKWSPVFRTHFWMMTCGYHVDPAMDIEGVDQAQWAEEALCMVAGPGCFYCQRVWDETLTGTKCPGPKR